MERRIQLDIMTTPTSTAEVSLLDQTTQTELTVGSQQNAVPITSAVEPIRIRTPPSQGVGPEESRVVPDTSAQGTTATTTSPTTTAKVPFKEQVIAYAKVCDDALSRANGKLTYSVQKTRGAVSKVHSLRLT